jgi:hypothetical protein
MLDQDNLQLRVVLGSCERRGSWNVPSYIDARVTLGTMTIDLREADLGPDTTIEANLTLGSLEVIVPDDVEVDVDVDMLVSNVENHDRERFGVGWPAARRVRVIGKARFANCEVIPLRRVRVIGKARFANCEVIPLRREGSWG